MSARACASSVFLISTSSGIFRPLLLLLPEVPGLCGPFLKRKVSPITYQILSFLAKYRRTEVDFPADVSHFFPQPERTREQRGLFSLFSRIFRGAKIEAASANFFSLFLNSRWLLSGEVFFSFIVLVFLFWFCLFFTMPLFCCFQT